MRSTLSITCAIADSWVDGVMLTPAFLPKVLMSWSEWSRCGPASACTVMMSEPALAKASMKGSQGAIIRCTSNTFLECGRNACTTSGPIVIFDTKCPSITSTWIQSQPAASMARTSSPSRAKSAERMDGAMMMSPSAERSAMRASFKMRQVWPAHHRLTRPCSANPLSSVLREGGDGRQGLAFQPFEKSATGGGDIAEVLTHASCIERSHGVAAPGDGQELALLHATRRLAHQLIGSFAEGLELEGPNRTVPHQSPDLRETPLEVRDRFRADIEDHLVRRDIPGFADMQLRAGLEFLGHHEVTRQDDLAIVLACARHDLLDHRNRVRLAQRLSDLDALCIEEGAGHAASENELVH